MNKLLIFIFVVYLCRSLDAFCAKRCGEPWTIGPCVTCACAAPATSCAISPTTSSCGCTKDTESCSCIDPEPSNIDKCLKAKVRFPEVEYPMSIIEMKPYFGGCCF